jgi:UDP-glucose 4-epimerase
MRILVTGGAGYIGSHVVRSLRRAGHEPVLLDDLKEGHREAAAGAVLVQGDIADPAALDAALARGPADGVIHMAASCLVGESMQRPGLYYENNVVRTLRLLELLAARGVKRFVFSSTAAVYGEPDAASAGPITEDCSTDPTNVYGETKLAVEKALSWYCRRAGLRAISLRYFNAAGADPAGDIGEDHDPETHLIPLVLRAALGAIPYVEILGRDYPTPDGTCLRDYIHVNDLAAAHVAALSSLEGADTSDGALRVYNLGAQKASSVLEVIEAARRVTGRPIVTRDAPRRAGDPPVLLASSEKIRKELGWSPAMSDLDTILATAWKWHNGHPHGFGD